MLSVAIYCYAKCRYAECRGALLSAPHLGQTKNRLHREGLPWTNGLTYSPGKSAMEEFFLQQIALSPHKSNGPNLLSKSCFFRLNSFCLGCTKLLNLLPRDVLANF